MIEYVDPIRDAPSKMLEEILHDFQNDEGDSVVVVMMNDPHGGKIRMRWTVNEIRAESERRRYIN